MARPQTEFVFAQNIPWTDRHRIPGRPSVLWKILSEDSETGELTAIVRLPAKFSLSVASPYFEELYVLAGELSLDGRRMGRDGYAAIDRGRHTMWSSDHGADVLLWLDNDPLRHASDLVTQDVMALPWRGPMVPIAGAPPDLRRKVLRVDPNSGQYRNFLLCGMPFRYPEGWQERDLTHPCVEECFILSGDITGPQGVMTRGAYFWRPAQVPHGPFGSRDGYFAIFRFVKGYHVNVWGERYFPYRFDTPYAPILPPAQQAYRGQPPDGGARY